ncbi:SIMPL domain-containing protein [bacterium]|nr:SIMPL domain-containing protein [bacterium]
MQIKDYQIVLLGVLIALGSICSTYILSKSIVEFQKLQNQTIRVTGSASQNVTSDKASWTIRIKSTNPTLKEGYSKINADTSKVKAFLTSKGIDEKNIETASINSYENNRRLPNGGYTNEVESYTVYRTITVKSDDIKKLTDISTQADILVNQDINMTSENVQYFVSNLDDIKVKMVGEASKNAKERANSMIKGTNGKIGVMTNAKMGVFQIVPIDSTEVNDYGINDTSSIEKRVVATVSATFTVK